MVNTRKPDSAALSTPASFLVLLLGLYSLLQPSGVSLNKPTAQTVAYWPGEKADREGLLVLLMKFYGGAFILGAKGLPRPTSYTLADQGRLLDWLVKLYSSVAPS